MIIQEYALTSNNCKAQLPVGAKVLCARPVGKDIHIWVESDETKPVISYTFMAFPTGMKFPVILAPMYYIDTVQMGQMFWHIYEIKE